MCWSGEASFALAGLGAVTCVSAAMKGEKKEFYFPLLWFTLMELLQGFTYIWIDMCGNPTNQVLTLLGYIHIAFQPIFANMMYMYFLPAEVREKIQWWVYSACFAVAIVLIVNTYPFSWAVPATNDFVYDTHICSVSGAWHIAWHLPVFNTISFPIPYIGGYYGLLVFVLPFIYGSWKITLYHIVTGLLLARLLTNDFHETAAVWCLLSIGLLTVVAKTKVRDYLYVNTWYGLSFPKFMK